MTGAGGRELLSELLDALAASLDPVRLEEELRRRLSHPPTSSGADDGDLDLEEGAQDGAAAATAGAGSGAVPHVLLGKLVLEDLLDEAILGARPDDDSFPLRVLFGTLGGHLEDDGGFALANGLSFFFRVDMDEEAKIRLGLEVSRLYYRFAAENLEPEEVPRVSPLLAKLMSTELERVRFEAVDHMAVFDSAAHERVPDADGTAKGLRAPVTFLCRVRSNNMVRFKALVRT